MKLLEFLNTLSEAAQLDPDWVKAQTFYHGTTSDKAAQEIMEHGIDPNAKTRTKGFLSPVAGRAYLTPSVAYGQIYALGGVFAGHEMPLDSQRGSGYGYVFVIPGKDLVEDMQPDEDHIGEAVALCLQLEKKSKEYLLQYYKDPFLVAVLNDEDLVRRLHWMGNTYLTPNQKRQVMNGRYVWLANAGKKLVKYMTPEMKLALIKYGAHIAYAGPVMPSEAWRIDRTRSKELKPDGSNFFEVAQKIWSKPADPVKPGPAGVNESVSDIIYHGTSVENALLILESGEIQPGYASESVYRKNPRPGLGSSAGGASFSRNIKKALEASRAGGDIAFGMSRAKLKQKYDVVPFDWDNDPYEEEEFVVTDESIPLEPYLIGIWTKKSLVYFKKPLPDAIYHHPLFKGPLTEAKRRNPARPTSQTPSEPGYLYHATNIENAMNIAIGGTLNVHDPWHGTEQEAWPDGATRKRTYFTRNAAFAWQFAPGDGRPALLRVAMNAGTFHDERHTGDVFTTEPIRASKIEILADNGKWLRLRTFFSAERAKPKGEMVESSELPEHVAATAKEFLSKALQDVSRAGDSTVVGGFWIESHTLGCRDAADDKADEWWNRHWEIYDEYSKDGISVVFGDAEDGAFVTITPQLTEMVEARQPRYYLRFGDIPEGERSHIGAAPNHIARALQKSDFEKGVSVYEVEWNAERQKWDIDYASNPASLNELIWQKPPRPAYLVTGRRQPEPGIDGEPLLRNVKIIKQVPFTDLYLPHYGPEDQYRPDSDDDDEEEMMEAMSESNIWVSHRAGQVWLNPTRSTILTLLQKYGELRGYVDVQGKNYIICNAFMGTHTDLMMTMLDQGGQTEETKDQWLLGGAVYFSNKPTPKSERIWRNQLIKLEDGFYFGKLGHVAQCPLLLRVLKMDNYPKRQRKATTVRQAEVSMTESWLGYVFGEHDDSKIQVYDIRSQKEFMKILAASRYKMLRAFLTNDGRLIAWDADTLVHPEANGATIFKGQEETQLPFGLPLHLSSKKIVIRHHGSHDYHIWQMLHEVMTSRSLRIIYGGNLPPIFGEDNDGEEERLDTKDWGNGPSKQPGMGDWDKDWGSY